MQLIIDPAADLVWDSAGTIVTETGELSGAGFRTLVEVGERRCQLLADEATAALAAALRA